MIKLGILKIIIGFIWSLCWKTNSPALHTWSTELWCKQANREAEWLVERVYNGSGWHGLNGTIDGRPMVITVQELEDWKAAERERMRLRDLIGQGRVQDAVGDI